MTRRITTRSLAALASLLWIAQAFAGGTAVEDGAMRAPIPPDLPGGPKPVLQDCQVTTERSRGADGAETERTHRACRWSVPGAEP